MITFRIDDAAVRTHAAHLSVLHRSALPVVIRQTLNSAAMDVKTRTMPAEVTRFEKRKPTFFKANSAVTLATGFEINKMRATVGFRAIPTDKSHAVEDLEQQEEGGEIANRAFIALPGARRGNKWSGMVRKGLTMGDIGDDIVDPEDRKAFLKSEGFIQSAVHAMKSGKPFVFSTDRKKGARVLYRINKIGRNKKGDTFVAKTKVYNVKAGRRVDPDSKYEGFMQTASDTTRQTMPQVFKRHADKKILSLRK